MAKLRWAAIGAMLALLGCGSPVPADMFLTLSVSAQDVAVVTTINGKPNVFLSGDSGSMTGSIPLNKYVHEGQNQASFSLDAIELAEGTPPDTGFLATLEISMRGEMVDTLAPGARTIFSRTLSVAEVQSLIAGDTVTITEEFKVDRSELDAIKENAIEPVITPQD